jgi:16S rRNA (cytidine1402-2'-O)-methyltransferase
MSSNLGLLWIVATPLGNPGDLSPRARDTLEAVDGILVEDTRRAGLLFSRCGLRVSAPLTSFHEHNEEVRLPKVLEDLKAGHSLALISDAGTPLLSDPGYRLVRACRLAGIKVSPVPGPSAPVAALCASGLPPLPFIFLGFLPRKQSERAALFRLYSNLPATLIFFERKDRLADTLAVAAAELGTREACIARELTKTYEEFIPFILSEATDLPEEFPGEITVLIGPPVQGIRDLEKTVLECIDEEKAMGGKAKDVSRRVKQRVRGWSGKEIYQLMQADEEGTGNIYG